MKIEEMVVTDNQPNHNGNGYLIYVGMKCKMTNTTKIQSELGLIKHA